MFQTREEEARPWCLCVSVVDRFAGASTDCGLVRWTQQGGGQRGRTYDSNKIRVAVQLEHAERVRPLPHLGRLVRGLEPFELDRPLVVRRLGQEKQDQHAAEAAQRRLQPEDVAPRPERHDDAADEGPEGWPDERAGQEPGEGCAAFGLGLVC